MADVYILNSAIDFLHLGRRKWVDRQSWNGKTFEVLPSDSPQNQAYRQLYRLANMTRSTLFLILLATVGANLSKQLRTRGTVEFIQDGPALHATNGTSIISTTTVNQDHRRMQRTRTVLAVRVINSGISPTVNAATIRQYLFTDVNSLKAQMMRCSGNTIVLNESRHGAVIDVHVSTAMRSNELKEAAGQAAIRSIGDLRIAADHVLFIFPKISDYFAEAETGYGLSYYNDHFGVSLAVLMHEIGHNLGLYHSGVPGDEYGDYSGYMGLAMVRRGGPLMCFNAANHWDLGWFASGRMDLGSTGPSNPLNLALNAFTNSPMRGPVLLKVAGNVYMQYHHASKHNIDSFQEFANRVVVIQKSSVGHTIRLAALAPGEEYRSSTFVVRACASKQSGGLNFMDISIGRTNTNCKTASLVAPPPVPAPRPQSVSWWNTNPAPAATVIAPAPVSNPSSSWWSPTSRSWW